MRCVCISLCDLLLSWIVWSSRYRTNAWGMFYNINKTKLDSLFPLPWLMDEKNVFGLLIFNGLSFFFLVCFYLYLKSWGYGGSLSFVWPINHKWPTITLFYEQREERKILRELKVFLDQLERDVLRAQGAEGNLTDKYQVGQKWKCKTPLYPFTIEHIFFIFNCFVL